MPAIRKTLANSGDFTPKAASNSVHVPQSKNSKKRLLNTTPVGSQWAHSMGKLPLTDEIGHGIVLNGEVLGRESINCLFFNHPFLIIFIALPSQ